MGAMLLAALAVPRAFGDDAVLFGLAYLAVRAMQIVLFAQGSDDLEVRDAAGAIAPSAVLAPALLLGGTFFGDTTQAIVWTVVLTADYAAAGVRGIGGWHLSPSHFAERHGLSIIIALGESIVAIGVGATGVDLGPGAIAAAALGVALAAALWWLYFDDAASAAERGLHGGPRGRAQNTMARDSYSFGHLPMVVGIVLLALGAKKTLAHVGDPLRLVGAVALAGGVALYLLAHVAFRRRTVGTIHAAARRRRPVRAVRPRGGADPRAGRARERHADLCRDGRLRGGAAGRRTPAASACPDFVTQSARGGHGE